MEGESTLFYRLGMERGIDDDGTIELDWLQGDMQHGTRGEGLGPGCGLPCCDLFWQHVPQSQQLHVYCWHSVQWTSVLYITASCIVAGLTPVLACHVQWHCHFLDSVTLHNSCASHIQHDQQNVTCGTFLCTIIAWCFCCPCCAACNGSIVASLGHVAVRPCFQRVNFYRSNQWKLCCAQMYDLRIRGKKLGHLCFSVPTYWQIWHSVMLVLRPTMNLVAIGWQARQPEVVSARCIIDSSLVSCSFFF